MEKDYDKIIQDNKEALIDSYVKQYGEKYRKQIETKFEQIRFCLFVTPDRLSIYNQIKSNIVGLKLSAECLKKLGITNFEYQNYGIKSHNEDINKLIHLLFLWDKQITLFNFNCNPFSKMSMEDIAFIERITKKKIEEVRDIVMNFYKTFRDTYDDGFYFGNFTYNSEEKEYEQYVEEQTRLLKKYHIPYTDFKLASLDSLITTYHLTTEEMAEITEEIKRVKNKINSFKFKKSIINGFNPSEFCYNDDFFDIISGQDCIAMSGYELHDSGVYIPVVYFSPFNTCGYEDIIFDHEARHAIEFFLKPRLDKKYQVKTGLCIREYTDDSVYHSRFNMINEVMTQKMSIESTAERQKNGIFIFTDKDTVGTGNSTGYDKYISNFNRLVDESLYKRLLDARMASADTLFSIVSENNLEELNSAITCNRL